MHQLLSNLFLLSLYLRLGSQLLTYHGLHALNTTIFDTWDSYFEMLLEEPDTVLLIQTPVDLGRRAYSEFDIDIEPARLCMRILSVRELIATELTGDLKAISTMGQQIWDSYWYNTKMRKESTPSKSGGGKGGIGFKDGSSPSAFDRPSLLFMNFDPQYDGSLAPSPLRLGNFDLLYNLITQEAVTQLMQTEVIVGENERQNTACKRYLQNFYQEHLLTHFVGAQFYGKGDDFIEELMMGSPIMLFGDKDGDDASTREEGAEIGSNDSESTTTPPLVVEPLRIAEQVLLRRDKLALEWFEIMKGIPSEHMDIRKKQLSRLMGEPTEKKETTDEFQ
eukprot:g1255.t1.1.5e1746a9 g1255  g1255.t1 contig10:1717004-1718092(+)